MLQSAPIPASVRPWRGAGALRRPGPQLDDVVGGRREPEQRGGRLLLRGFLARCGGAGPAYAELTTEGRAALETGQRKPHALIARRDCGTAG